MKYALITGAYGGMGYATVKRMLASGYTVFALDKVVKEKEEGVIPIKVDLTDASQIQNAFNEVSKITNELNAIIHFAGVYMLNSLIELPNEKFEQIFKVNVFSAYYVNKAFVPLLKKGSKIIITTSELAPLDPLPFTGIYAITKSALDKYAFSLKMELQLLDISVSVLRAGAVSTGMLSVSTSQLQQFCETTKIYKCNAERFKKIVDKVEAKNVSPEKLAKKVEKILNAKKPKFAYKINRNKLLILLNAMPNCVQFKIIKKILK